MLVRGIVHSGRAAGVQSAWVRSQFIMGRRARFEAQVLPHLDAAFRYARWLASGSVEAEDVVQEAMLRAYRPLTACAARMPKPGC